MLNRSRILPIEPNRGGDYWTPASSDVAIIEFFAPDSGSGLRNTCRGF